MKQNRIFAPLIALVTAGSTPGAQAAILVSGTVFPLGGSYRYEASVINTDPTDYLVVMVTDAPLGDPLIGPSLTAPPGFQASYDSGLPSLDFVFDGDLFTAGTTVGVFSFESLVPPDQGTFATVVAVDGALTEFAGAAQWVLIPEPDLAWMAAPFACLTVWLTRRRRG